MSHRGGGGKRGGGQRGQRGGQRGGQREGPCRCGQMCDRVKVVTEFWAPRCQVAFLLHPSTVHRTVGIPPQQIWQNVAPQAEQAYHPAAYQSPRREAPEFPAGQVPNGEGAVPQWPAEAPAWAEPAAQRPSQRRSGTAMDDATRAQYAGGVAKKRRHRDAGSATRMVSKAVATSLLQVATKAPASSSATKRGGITGNANTSVVITSGGGQQLPWEPVANGDVPQPAQHHPAPNLPNQAATLRLPNPLDPLRIPAPAAALGAPPAGEQETEEEIDEDLLLRDQDPLLSSAADFSSDPY